MKRKLKCYLVSVFLLIIFGINLHASDLVWKTSAGEVSGYKIYYGLSQGNYPFSEDVGNVTRYSLNNFSLNEGTTYYFIVRAYNSTGESGNSNFASYAVPAADDTTPPIPPGGVAGEIVNENVLLTWDPNTEIDISGYRVYYGLSSRNYGLPIRENQTACSITGLDTDVPYYIAVTAVDTSGNESGFSSPEIMKIITATVAGSLLKWDPSIGIVTGYKIYYGISEGNYTEVVDVGNVTEYALDTLPLTEGVTYYFVVRAYNAYGESGNSNVATYIIGNSADTEAPSVFIGSPTTNTTYNTIASNINISGTASDNIAVTQVTWSNSSGGAGIASGTTSWSVSSIPLAEGENIITIRARDAASNESTDVLAIYTPIFTKMDTTAPVVTILSPTSNTSYITETGDMDLGGTASDNKKVTQVIWANHAGGSGIVLGTTSWSVSGIPLSEGENIVVITARDEFGNESTDTLTVVYTIPDTTAPVVTISLPTSNASYNTEINNLNIGGTASDNVGVTQVLWSNTTGGSGAVSGTDNWNVSNIGLVEGENNITITARDAAGNESTDYIAVQYIAQTKDTTSPVIKLLSPTTKNRFFSRRAIISLSGIASDDIGVKQILWSNSKKGSGMAVGTTDWSIPDIALAKYWNVIKIKAIDLSGNESVFKLYVFGWF